MITLKTTQKINLLLLFTSLIATQVVFAQSTPPAPTAPPPGFPIPGIVFATALALGYGAYKTTQNKNSK